MEIKLTQDTYSINQDTLCLILLDLSKAYDTVDRKRLISTLERLLRGTTGRKLLETFWAHQEFVTRQNWYHGTNFTATRGMMQGGIISPTLFNVVVDNVVQMWLVMIIKEHTVEQEVLGLNMGRFLGLFYANNDMLRAQKSEWL